MKKIINKVIAALSAPSAVIREEALECIERDALQIPFGAIEHCFYDSNILVRTAFLNILYLYDDEIIKKYCFMGLENRDPLIKLTASDTLSGSAPALNNGERMFIMKKFNTIRDPATRRNLAEFLAQTGDAEIISFLESKIRNNHSDHVLAGIYLGLIILGKKKEYTEKFFRLLKSKDHTVCCYVANSIGGEFEFWEKFPVQDYLKKCLKRYDGKAFRIDEDAIRKAYARLDEMQQKNIRKLI